MGKSKAEALELGGNNWHDNPAYEEIQLKEQMLIEQINDVKNDLKNAIVKDLPQNSAIGLGSTVVYENETGAKFTIKIGDSMTSDPQKGVISLESPLGKAILGSRVGETRNYIVNTKKFSVKILSIQ